MKKSTNKWALERSRESANALLKKAGTEPLLVEILSDLLWVADHQQDQLEQMYAWTKYIIEQALVDHAHSDGTVQVNETCHQAIKDWHYTEPPATAPTVMQTPPADGERHDQWQYIVAYGYWVYMVSHDNWDDCAGLCEELCQRYGIGVWVDAAQPGDYHPAANVSNTDAIRAIDANKG